MLEVVSTATDTIFSYPATLFSDLNTLILVALGVPLAFWVLHKVISLVRAR